MPLIRNKRALKAHIKAYLTSFRAQHGLLEVEDIKALSARFAEEEQLEGAERSSFSLPPLPLEEEVVAVLLHKGVVEWLKEQHASADVLQQVMTLMPAQKEPEASTASLSSIRGGVSKLQTQAESHIGPSPTSSSLSFSALRKRLRETRDQMEKMQAEGFVSDIVASNNAEKEKGVKPNNKNHICNTGIEGKRERMEFQTTEGKTERNEGEETMESESELKEEGREILNKKKTREGGNLSDAPLGSTTAAHVACESEKHFARNSSSAFFCDELESNPSLHHSSLENFTSEVLEKNKRTQEQEAGKISLSPSFLTADFFPLDVSKDEPIKKKIRNEAREENDGVSEKKDSEGGEKKKRVKELLPLSSILSNSHLQPQQSSARRMESQSVFHVTPLNDDELFESIPLPPAPPPVPAHSYYYHPHGYPPHSHQFHAPAPSTYSHWTPTHLAPPLNLAQPYPSSFSYSSSPNPRMDPPFDSPPESHRHHHDPHHHYSPYNLGGDTSAGRNEERGGTTGYPSSSLYTHSYQHANEQGAGRVASSW